MDTQALLMGHECESTNVQFNALLPPRVVKRVLQSRRLRRFASPTDLTLSNGLDRSHARCADARSCCRVIGDSTTMVNFAAIACSRAVERLVLRNLLAAHSLPTTISARGHFPTVVPPGNACLTLWNLVAGPSLPTMIAVHGHSPGRVPHPTPLQERIRSMHKGVRCKQLRLKTCAHMATRKGPGKNSQWKKVSRRTISQPDTYTISVPTAPHAVNKTSVAKHDDAHISCACFGPPASRQNYLRPRAG